MFIIFCDVHTSNWIHSFKTVCHYRWAHTQTRSKKRRKTLLLFKSSSNYRNIRDGDGSTKHRVPEGKCFAVPWRTLRSISLGPVKNSLIEASAREIAFFALYCMRLLHLKMLFEAFSRIIQEVKCYHLTAWISFTHVFHKTVSFFITIWSFSKTLFDKKNDDKKLNEHQTWNPTKGNLLFASKSVS